jgi:hypothetical protein
LSRVFGTSLPDLFRLLAKVASTIHRPRLVDGRLSR